MAGENDNGEVHLFAVSGEVVASFRIEAGWTALEVKERVEQELGYPLQSQQLVLQGGDTLDDDAPVAAFPTPLRLILVLLPFDKTRALFTAARKGHEAAARWLLSHTARDHQESLRMLAQEVRDGSADMTALSEAAFQGHSAVCAALLEALHTTEERVNILSAIHCYDLTALHFAVGTARGVDDSASAMTCRVLLAGAPNEEVLLAMLLAQNEDAKTALHVAAGSNRPLSCTALLEVAPSEEVRRAMLARNNGREIALHSAAFGSEGATVRALLDWAADEEWLRAMLLERDEEGSTALHVAMAWGSVSACHALLEAASGAELRRSALLARDDAGCTALHCAARRGRAPACRMALEAATVELRREMLAMTDNSGCTVAQVAKGDVCQVLDSA